MKKVLVTGATGFIGSHVVPALLEKGYAVTAVARDAEKAKTKPWIKDVEFIACDIHDNPRLPTPDVLVHLAWPGLPNYKDSFHVDKNFPADLQFIRALDAPHVLVTGTCFEYGMATGCLSEDMDVAPTNPYGQGKDMLRRALQEWQAEHPFTLQWARLFYMYGPGQNPKSLLALLDRAIEAGDKTFNMSGGAQIRDFSPVEKVAASLACLVGRPEVGGVVNVCSGNPVTVRELVENRIREKGADIQPNLGFYPYPDYEPMEFWGDARKILAACG